jgi:glycosyltransferase involved in cell wall biosynthesis
MRVLIVLTYYRPHISGLTIYAERLASGLAARGHQVTVLTSRYDTATPQDETVHDVRVVRAPVLCRVSKGVIMPTFGLLATQLVRRHDVVSLHLPQFDAAGVALRGRWMRKPTVLTYQCDLALPASPMNALASPVIQAMNLIAGRFAHRLVAHTEDFATHSTYLRRFAAKLEIIPPPVDMRRAPPDVAAAFRRRTLPDGRGPVLGMAARLASEKGVEVLLRALPRVLEAFPDAQVVFAGPHENVIGEKEYARRLQPLLRQAGDRWRFLGSLPEADMPAFFSNLDVLVVPSLNSTESFGLVQVEAMQCGAPVVASDLPGVRQPVAQTGMGETVPAGDPAALADAMFRVIREKHRYVKPRCEIEARFSTARTVAAYEALFRRLLDEIGSRRHG